MSPCADRTDTTRQTLRASWSNWTGVAPIALSACETGLALRTLRTYRTLRAHWAGVALSAGSAIQAGLALRTLWACRTDVALVTLEALQTGLALGALSTGGPIVAFRADWAGRTLWTRGALRTNSSCRARRT